MSRETVRAAAMPLTNPAFAAGHPVFGRKTKAIWTALQSLSGGPRSSFVHQPTRMEEQP